MINYQDGFTLLWELGASKPRPANTESTAPPHSLQTVENGTRKGVVKANGATAQTVQTNMVLKSTISALRVKSGT